MYWSKHDLEAHNRDTKKPIAIATRCSVHHGGAAVAGVAAGETFRWAHVMKTKASHMQLVFANFYPTDTTESSNANAITISVSVEYNGRNSRVFFGGKREYTIDQGGIAVSDTLDLQIPVGATFYTRVCVKVPADANTYPVGMTINTSAGDGKAPGDVSLSTGTAGMVGNGTTGFGPAAIVGIPVEEGAVAFALYGDSIVADASGDGWPVQLVKDNYGYSILSRPSSQAASLWQNSANAYRMRMAKYFTHAIVNFGTNDFDNSTSYTTQAGYIEDIWNQLIDMGLIVYASTVMPRSTGTFTTETGQAVDNGNIYNDKRVLHNNRLRNGYWRQVTVLDVADAVEPYRDAGIWKANYTTDGIHPEPDAEAAVVAAVTSKLGL